MDTKTPVPPSAVTPVTPTFTPEQFREFMDTVRAGGAAAMSPATEAMIELAKAQNAMAEAQNRTVRRSNSYSPGISPFSNPKGEEADPKAPLDRETWWMGTRVEHTQATPEEIEAFNKVTTNKVWRGDPKFGSEVTPKRRFIMLPHVSVDERMALPPNIPLAIRELLSGEDAIDPIKMEEKISKLEKQLAQVLTKINKSADVLVEDTATLAAEF